MKRRLIAAALAVLCLSGCSRAGNPAGRDPSALPRGAAENEILTLSPVARDKQLVTIHYEYGLDIVREVEAAIEEQFPHVDVVMVHDGANNSKALLKANLAHGAECDLIFSRALCTEGEAARKYLLDLSGEAFINHFYLTSLDTCIQSDGGLYFLPGPANLYGVIYDKTVLEEHNWPVPSNYTEFVELIHTIDSSGLTVTEELDGVTREVPVRAIRPSLKFTDSFRSLFYPFAYQQVFAGQDNLEWLTAYQQGESSMIGHMEPFADILKKLLEDGVIRLSDWDYMPRYRLPMLCDSHSAVMICGPLNTFSTELLVHSDHEYAILPIFAGDEPGSDYLYSIPNYFMAINRASAEVSPERKQLLLDIMAFLCNPDTQEKLFGEANTLVSNLKGVTPGENRFNAGIQQTIREGRIITDFQLMAESALNDAAPDMLTGRITVEQWLKGGDADRDKWLDGAFPDSPVELGVCEDSLSRFETALLVGQVYRDVTGADIALVYVNKSDQGANCSVFAGPVDSVAAYNIDPGRTSPAGEGLATGTLTGQQIIDCLNGIHLPADHFGQWYYVASGLNVEFAPWMPAGERLVSCKLPDGTELDPRGTYKAAFMSDKLFGAEAGELAILRPADEQILKGQWIDHFSQWIAEHGGVIKRPEQTTVLNWKTQK